MLIAGEFKKGKELNEILRPDCPGLKCNNNFMVSGVQKSIDQDNSPVA